MPDEYKEIKKKQEEFLKKVFKTKEFSIENCLKLGGLKVEGNKIMPIEESAEPSIYDFLHFYKKYEEDDRSPLEIKVLYI